MSVANELLERLDKLQTTELGIVRIKRNLSLDVDDVVEWCRDKIKSDNAVITRNDNVIGACCGSEGELVSVN